METASYVMTVSGNGQVSIPAETRSRWKARRVVVVDMGDRIVMRPMPEDPVGELVGKYATRGVDSATARRRSRRDEATRESRR
ncbi:MAG: AbrB/MazE/SpoVT family DNA-binding domain-containing protein [Sporichthyaceae bacterium]